MNWKAFQHLVADIQEQFMPGWTVKRHRYETDAGGAHRQLDAVLEYSQGVYRLRILVEATTTTKPVDVSYIDAVASKYRRLGCHLAVVACEHGYTKDALAAAKAEQVETWVLRPLRERDVEWTVGKIPIRFEPSYTVVSNVDLRTRKKSGRIVTVQFAKSNHDQFTLYDAAGKPRGNLWDWFEERFHALGHHEFPVQEGDHVYVAATPAPLEAFAFQVARISMGPTGFEIDLEEGIDTVYEDAQTGLVRMVPRP